MLDGLLHHGTSLKIDTDYVDTGGVSDHVFNLCAMLGFRFCPRLRDSPTGSWPASSRDRLARPCSRSWAGASRWM